MGDIAEKKLAMKDSFPSFGGIFCHFLPEILNKHNIKETACKGNIWGPFYIPKGEHTGQNKKILCHEKHLHNTYPKTISRNV